jgi:hypothetical protein
MQTKGLLRIALMALMVLLIQGTWVLAGTTGNVEGKVTDQNGNGVVGAKVTASSPGQTISVTTLANGFYSILNLSPDTYTVTASKDGYDTSSTYGVTVTADQATAADIKLRTTVKTIGHVTTTATASVVSKTVTGDLYAVNAAAISNYNGGAGGAETLYSQNSVVGQLPGVVRAVGSGSGYGGQGQLSLRGGAPDQIGYELEGVPLNRGFDFYNGTAFTTNGLASLQVYTGGAPADAGRAMSGYINQVISRGKYPGGADFTAVVGSPLYNHTVQADVYGSTPDSKFSYYVSTLATNNYVNFGDRSNLANTSINVPAGDAGCGAFNNGPAVGGTNGFLINCSVANIMNQPVTNGSYGSTPFNAGRDTTANLHWSFEHGGLNDDLQALYLTGTTAADAYGLYGVVGADPSQASTNYSGDGTVGFGPNAQALTWPTGSFYYGQTGQPYNPALLTNLTWPTSQGSVAGQIPGTFNDSETTQYAIEKLGYTRAISQSSFLRVYGYKTYSSWSLDQPINGFVGSSFYQLHDNSTGISADYQNQINQQNLIKVIGDWSRDLTLRYNYFNYASSGAPVACAAGGAPVACTPGALVSEVGAPLSNWSTVTPLDWDGVISDSWKPSDKFLVDLGIRWDYFGFQLMPMQINGPQGIAYLGEETNGKCLDGFNYSPSDPKVIGPNGNQNCFQLLSAAPGPNNKFAPGAFNWQDANGTLSFTDISPRFGLTFNADPRDVFRVSVGRYVQPPNSAFEQYRDNPLWGPGRTIGRLNQFYAGLGFNTVHGVLPEDSTNYDLSWEHEWTGGISSKITPFYRDTRNQVLNIPFDPQSPSFVTGDNFGQAHIQGFEFLVTKAVTGQNGIGGTLSTTYTNSKLQFERVNGSSYIDLLNGTTASACNQIDPHSGALPSTGICGYNLAYGTNYPMLDPNSYYYPSFTQAPTATGPSYVVPWVVNLTVDARYNGFDFVPTFNYQSGNPYGDPLNFPDGHCPTVAAGANAAASGCTPLPAGKAFYGGNGPDPYTGAFDAPGSLNGPSWWTLNLGITHAIGHNLMASILGTNLLSGVSNHGYAWEQPSGQQIINYGDNGFYNSAPLGAFASTLPKDLNGNAGAAANGYYGNNYYPYTAGGALPIRSYVFSVSAKI